jgi:L-malate glycosyltransferase
MRILHTVQSYLPERNGMQKVVQEISERLVETGHEVTVATSGKGDEIINGVNIKRFDCTGNYVTGMAGEIPRYKWFITDEEDYDIIINFAAQQWATDYVLPYLSWIDRPKVFVPTGFSGLYNPEYAGYFGNMKRWMNQYDMNVFHSYGYRDIVFAKTNHVPDSKIITIPNGASEQEFPLSFDPDIRERLGIPEDHFLVLLVGSHTGQKGHTEAIEIFERAKVAPATLVIAGEQIGFKCTVRCQLEQYLSRRHKRVIVFSPPRKDILELYRAADVFLFPSNIEAAPLVIYEAMASSLPLLATGVGNVSEIVREHDCGLVLPGCIDERGYSHADINNSVKCLERLANNKDERKRLGMNGYNAWKEHYTWEKIAKQYEQLYESLGGENA